MAKNQSILHLSKTRNLTQYYHNDVIILNIGGKKKLFHTESALMSYNNEKASGKRNSTSEVLT